jgi:hypothetical protein
VICSAGGIKGIRQSLCLSIETIRFLGKFPIGTFGITPIEVNPSGRYGHVNEQQRSMVGNRMVQGMGATGAPRELNARTGGQASVSGYVVEFLAGAAV